MEGQNRGDKYSVGKTQKSQMMEKLMMEQQAAFKISEADGSATSGGCLYLRCHGAVTKCISLN